jgi:hypothetical protein
MKRLAGLLALAAVFSATSIFGATSASATVLCKAATEHCAASSAYAKGTIIEASLKTGTKWVLNAGYRTFTCEEASIKGEVTNPGGPTTSGVSGSVTTFSLGKCNGSVEVVKPGTFTISYSGSGNGGLALEGLQIMTANESFCMYGGPVSTSFSGGAMASIKASGSVPLKEGFPSCAKPATLTAEYTVTKPEPLYVERDRTAAVLCKTATFPCSGGASGAFGLGTPIQLSLIGSLFTFTGGSETYNGCGEVTIAGEVTSKVETGVDVSGKITKLTFASCLTKETTIVLGNFRITYSSGNNGFLTLEGFKVEDGAFGCNQTGPATMSLTAGTTGAAVINYPLLNKDGLCPNPLIWKGEFVVSAPTPLYVSEL